MRDLGVHLPLLTWDEPRSGPASLIEYVRTAERHGFAAVSVNDHTCSIAGRGWTARPRSRRWFRRRGR